jgi:hypothetical protein
MEYQRPFIEIIAELENLLRSDYLRTPPPHTLAFSFRPGMAEPDGENTEWQATITLDRANWVEYGSTLEIAAHRLLYMVQHPDLYPDPGDD